MISVSAIAGKNESGSNILALTNCGCQYYYSNIIISDNVYALWYLILIQSFK